MFSKSCKYAIRAVLYLTQHSNKKIGSKEIAENLNIPAPFLAKTLQELTKKKIISSMKGPNGGFYLSEENQQKRIIDIIYCIEGELFFEKCFLGKPECNSENPCMVHNIYLSFKKNLLETFSEKKLSFLVDKEVKFSNLVN